MAFLETEPETDVAFYENLPATADHDGDSKSSSTSGQAPARSEHLSLRRQPLHEEFSDLVPEQTTTDAHVFSSNNYMVSDFLVTHRHRHSTRNTSDRVSSYIPVTISVSVYGHSQGSDTGTRVHCR